MLLLVLIGIAIAIFRSVEAALWFAAGVILAVLILGGNVGRFGIS